MRTYDNPVPQAIELAEVDFDRGVTQVPLPTGGFASFNPTAAVAGGSAGR